MVRLCWWCCHDIPGDQMPLHMPYKFEKDKFYTCGQFCSWPCVKAFNIFSGRSQIGLVCDLITQYRFKVTGKISSVNAAPPRFALEAFGGTMTIDEFRTGGKKVTVRTPLDCSWVELPNELYKKQAVDVAKCDELVLKRSKPLKRDVGGIQKMLLKK